MLVTLEALKSFMSVTRSFDVADDDLLTLAINSAGDEINTALGRKVALAATPLTASTRTFGGSGGRWLRVDDFVSLTSVTLGADVIDTTSYWARPFMPDEPADQAYFEIGNNYGWYLPYGEQPNYTVNAVWGWATIPAGIQMACLILAKDIVANQSVSFGIAAFTDYAAIRARENPQVWKRLMPYEIRQRVGGSPPLYAR